MRIEEQLKTLKSKLPESVTLVAVSKTKSNPEIMEAYRAGQRAFGENKVQELTAKWEELPQDIEWHMIGHLQRNKVKYIAPFVHLIHSVDSLRLLQEIDKQGSRANRVIDCLLQVHIAEESTKFGFDARDLTDLLDGNELQGLNHIRIRGLMGMATFTPDTGQIKREFRFLKGVFDAMATRWADADILSMGMSGDYELAIAEGSTMVRIGSTIFGERNYGTTKAGA